jgi:hypothetical protein
VVKNPTVSSETGMAKVWRGIKGWVGSKHAELSKKQALYSAIQSGEDEEVMAALALARHECVQWKGGLAMSHDEMSLRLFKYLTEPFPKQTRDKNEEVVTPLTLAESMGNPIVIKKIKREIEKYQNVAGVEDDARKKAEAHRGRSTNDRANEARSRLRDIQRKNAKEEDDEGADGGGGASDSLAETKIGGRYQPKK